MIQTQLSIVHLESGLNMSAATQITTANQGFSAAAMEVGTTDKLPHYGDVTTPKILAVKLTSGDPLLIGVGGTDYPFRLQSEGESIMIRLDVEGLLRITSFTAQADVARSLSGKSLSVHDADSKVLAWFNMPAAAAAGSIDFNLPQDGDTVEVGGTTFTYRNSPSDPLTEFSDEEALVDLISDLSGLSATQAPSSQILVTADTPGTAGNAITLSVTGTGNMAVSGPALTGGVNASTAPIDTTARLVPVSLSINATANQVALALTEAFTADLGLTVTADGAIALFTNRATGARSAASAGDTGWSTPVVVQNGGDSPVIRLKSLGTSQIVVASAPA